MFQLSPAKYPESDRKFMGDPDDHRKEIIRLMEMLEQHFAGQRVYVSGKLLLFYEKDNPRKFVVPDIFVVKGVEPGERRSYKLWFENKPPDVILEITSRKTKKADTDTKPDVYRQLPISEYYLFDPNQEYLDPTLQGFRVRDGQYERIAPDAEHAVLSESLGLRLQVRGRHLMLYRLDTGERLLTAKEALEIESEARRAAEVEAARLREELRRRDTT